MANSQGQLLVNCTQPASNCEPDALPVPTFGPSMSTPVIVVGSLVTVSILLMALLMLRCAWIKSREAARNAARSSRSQRAAGWPAPPGRDVEQPAGSGAVKSDDTGHLPFHQIPVVVVQPDDTVRVGMCERSSLELAALSESGASCSGSGCAHCKDGCCCCSSASGESQMVRQGSSSTAASEGVWIQGGDDAGMATEVHRGGAVQEAETSRELLPVGFVVVPAARPPQLPPSATEQRAGSSRHVPTAARAPPPTPAGTAPAAVAAAAARAAAEQHAAVQYEEWERLRRDARSAAFSRRASASHIATYMGLGLPYSPV